MVLLLAALLMGFVLARINLHLLPVGGSQIMDKLGNLALLLLLFSMGSSLGSNSELVKSLPTLGLKALVLSLSAILGSVILVWFLSRVGRTKT